MNESDYPALFRSAEAASARTQSLHLRFIWVQSGLLILGAALATFPSESATGAFLCAAVFLASLGVTIYTRTQHFQRSWYQARALAESIKTTSWHYVMSAEPFDSDEVTSGNTFRTRLARLLSDNRSLGNHFAATPAADEQLTLRMQEIRHFSLDQKIVFYREQRIVEQREWYTRKASANRNDGRFWFIVLIVIYVAAIALVLLKVAAPHFRFYPTSVFAVAASGVMTWIQVKRYSEIAAAYVLTAHEIGILEQALVDIHSGPALSVFVADAESAFSREHTQWLARSRE